MESFESHQASSSEMRAFTWLVLLVQLLGLSGVIMVAVWMGHFRGGFAWQSDPSLEFNYHPLFMVIGMIFLYGDSILAYRVFRNDNKLYIKILHASLHASALIFGGVGLKAVFDSHNLAADPVPNLYSLHSWMGLVTVILFSSQWIAGFVSFLWPKVGMGLRRRLMPYHVFFGVAILCFACATCLMGITEKALWSMSKTYKNKPAEGILVNCLGLILVAAVTLIVYLVTRYEYKRPPSPEEEHLQISDE